MSITIAVIEQKALKAAEARTNLKDLVSQLDEETRALREIYRKRLIKLTEVAAKEQDALLDMVKESKSLFQKPRSVTFHGIKCGWQKNKGVLVIADEEKTIALIQKHFPEQIDTLVKITKVPVKTEISKLPVNDLKRIGGKIEDTDDSPFVKTMDSEIDKLVSALMESFCEGTA